MKLLRLKLENFKCHRDFELRVDAQDLTVYGRNFLGKSTLGDSLFWLLFGKNQDQRSGFEVRPLDPETLQPVPGLETTVEGEFEVGGKTLTLTRTYREVWTKTRSSAVAEKKGHTTDYRVNGVPQSESEYKRYIDALCDERTFRLLTSPGYFCSDDFGDSRAPAWQRRRMMLLDICGDVSDQDVVASKAILDPLPSILDGRSVDEYRRVLTSKRKNVNDELAVLPARIDQAKKAIPVASTLSLEEVDAIIGDYQAKIQRSYENRASLTSGGAIAEKTTRIREIEGELQAIKNRLSATGGDAAAQAQTLLRAKDGEIADLKVRVESLRRQAQLLEEVEKRGVEDSLARLRAEWNSINERTYAGDATCPSCGQALPEEQIAAAIETFNLRKSEQLSANREQGISKKRLLDEIESKLNGLAVQIENTTQRIEGLQAERASIEIPPVTVVNVEADPEYRALLAEKSSIESEIEDLRAGSNSEIAKIDAALSRFKNSLSESESAKTRIEEKARIEEQIATLEAREKELSKVFNDLKHEEFLLEEFVRAKVALLESRINERFRYVSFKLFNQQVNGGLTECCEAVKKTNGVPYADMSTSEQINAGLDIINVLSEHKGFAPFVVIDNCESNHDPLPTEGQQIRLAVSPTDAVLRFELTPRQPADASPEPAQGQLISA